MKKKVEQGGILYLSHFFEKKSQMKQIITSRPSVWVSRPNPARIIPFSSVTLFCFGLSLFLSFSANLSISSMSL
jgi:hypothetical protein